MNFILIEIKHIYVYIYCLIETRNSWCSMEKTGSGLIQLGRKLVLIVSRAQLCAKLDKTMFEQTFGRIVLRGQNC